METMQSDSRRVVVVLGAGRSGTSLMMQILVAMGMQVSGNLIPANASNPEGFFEDVDLKDIQAALNSCINAPAFIPLPENWLDTECAKKAKAGLGPVLQRLLDEHSGVLGIKDPRIATFLPLWTRLFNPMRVVPKYILAVREPRSVIGSFMRQYNNPCHIAELVWLLRNLEAIDNTAADCFIAHYEDWFTEPILHAQGLLHYTGLDKTFKGDLSEVIALKVKSNLNRASKDDYEIQNPYVKKLYSALKQCRGADFDHERLMAVVKECRHAMEGFKGWYQLAHETKKKLANTQARLESVSAEVAKVNALEARIKEFEKGKQRTKELGQQVNKLLWQLESFETWNS